ncbi:MAG: regulatory protein RecX [Candidatus Binatia bacterium]
MAARLLTRAPRTVAELTQRLVAMGYRTTTAEVTVARCVELGWVDDSALAEDRARQLRRRGAGPLRIGSDLEGRGLSERVVQEAIDASRDGRSEAEWARQVLCGQGEPVALRDRARAWRLLAGRGFPEEVVADVLGDHGE